ncbi:MAG TPA: NADH-quinone oxidoreductase subunit A [Bacteroidota bacterium]|jgi:NADH-quinone oxidoreductase subunit A|nr:NADH-quinone oxidoreductase subunit A [Bacteroidota bacterium]
MLTDFGRVLVFFIIGAIFVAGGFVMSWIIRPRRGYPNKLTSYECGEEPIGSSWIKFNIRFYVVALIFLVFDVEVVFLFPWAVVFQKLGMFAFLEMLVFLAILLIGYAYVWAKGDLDWDKPKPQIPVLRPRMKDTLAEKEHSGELVA